MSDNWIEVDSAGQLKDAVSQKPVSVIFAWIAGRDAVNASGGEEFEDCAENKTRSNRQYIRVDGKACKDDLKDIGVDLGGEPYPKFAIIAKGDVRCVEDVVNESLTDLIDKHGKA